MKIQTSELKGRALNWAVAKAKGFDSRNNFRVELFEVESASSTFFDCCADDEDHAKEQAENAYPGCDVQYVSEIDPFEPATNWEQGGPIIEFERIELRDRYPFHDDWEATSKRYKLNDFGSTALEAAMRCFVTCELGAEIEVPDFDEKEGD